MVVNDIPQGDLLSLVRKAKRANKAYLEELEQAFLDRREEREQRGIPVLAICGHGRAGKDLSAEYLCHVLKITYGGSCSSIILPLIAHSLDIPEEQAWEERHQHRAFWFDWCCALRQDDAAMLPRLLLGKGDMVVGIRSDVEMHAAESLLDFTVWIERPQADVDPTIQYGPEDCDVVIYNDGGKLSLYRKLDKLVSIFGDVRHAIRSK